MVFLSRQPLRPVVGVCLVEPHPEARVDVANAAISRLLASQAVCPVQIDTRLDSNETGLASPADVETLIARMDVLVTTRLHGMVLALKNGVPVVAVDAVPGGGKIQRQAEKIGWSTVLTLDRLTDQSLQQALAESLTPAARAEAAACAERARALAGEVRDEFLAAMARSAACEENYQARMTPHGRQRFVDSLRLSPSALWPWVSRLSLARRLLPSLMRVGRAVLPLPALRWLRWCSASASFKPPSAR
jgi:hypothetical protein